MISVALRSLLVARGRRFRLCMDRGGGAWCIRVVVGLPLGEQEV